MSSSLHLILLIVLRHRYCHRTIVRSVFVLEKEAGLGVVLFWSLLAHGYLHSAENPSLGEERISRDLICCDWVLMLAVSMSVEVRDDSSSLYL